MIDTGYAPGAGGATRSMPAQQSGGRSLSLLKQDYLGYLDGKRAEIDEQQEARRYYHGSQWTAQQIRALNKRRQPVVTYNRVGPAINQTIGLLEQLRQDPKGYARTQRHEHGAEVATWVVRYVLDQQRWAEQSPIVGMNGAVDAVAGIELVLEAGDRGDTEVGFDVVDPAGFFYDPRSKKSDFSDASYMGIAKWADADQVIAMFPDQEAAILAAADTGSELTSDPDSDAKWVQGDANHRRIRLVDHWYLKGVDWFWCIYTGSSILAEGMSTFRDEKRKTICKYIMFSANVDQDGDRYGFVRGMKSPQDEVNQRRSKGIHISNSRRIIVRDGQGLDVEKVRTESVRPDGVIVIPPGAEMPEFDDAARGAELTAQLGFLQEAKGEIDRLGPNRALVGDTTPDLSGRAIALLQQAGIAEIAPFFLSYKGWKLRVYRAIWNAVRDHWTAERWIRVTDDEAMSKWLPVNQLTFDPATGQSQIVNQLGALDVDIIMDEGPDTINQQADAFESIRDTLSAVGPLLSPAKAEAAMEIMIENSSMPSSSKQKFRDAGKQQQPNPMQQKAAMLELAEKQADVRKTNSEADLNSAKIQQIGADVRQAQVDGMREDAAASDERQMRVAEMGHERRMQDMDLVGRRMDLIGKARQQEAQQQQGV